MTKDEARREILREWKSWITKENENPTGLVGLRFFGVLQKERGYLLDFRSASADKWQVVHGWLLRAGYVSD
jgi:hypothetical protein